MAAAPRKEQEQSPSPKELVASALLGSAPQATNICVVANCVVLAYGYEL